LYNYSHSCVTNYLFNFTENIHICNGFIISTQASSRLSEILKENKLPEPVYVLEYAKEANSEAESNSCRP